MRDGPVTPGEAAPFLKWAGAGAAVVVSNSDILYIREICGSKVFRLRSINADGGLGVVPGAGYRHRSGCPGRAIMESGRPGGQASTGVIFGCGPKF